MSDGKSGAAGASHDYYGSIAGLVCGGRLDFIWGLLVDDKLVWPKAELHEEGKQYEANQAVHKNGIIYETPSTTTATPPASPWIRFLRTRTGTAVNPYTFTVEDYGTALLYWGTADQAYPTPAGPGVNQVHTPIIAITTKGDKRSVTLTCATSGATIKYQITKSGTPPASTWSTYSGAVQIGSQKVLHTYALKATMTDSAIASTDDAKEFLKANGHPPYRHRAVLGLQKFLFGQERQTAPNVVLLGGRAPDQSLITGTAADLDDEWQANAWCVIAELLTHPVIGLGIPASEFDDDSFQDEAERLEAAAARTYLSPIFDRGQKVRAVIANLLSYFDLWIRRDPVTGLYTAGHWPHNEAAPSFDASTTMDMHDLTEEIAWDSEGFAATSNATSVQFEDIAYAFKSRPAPASNLANRVLSRRVRSRVLDRPFITRAAQANALAVEEARFNGDVRAGGTLTVRAEKATAITPGSLFLLTDDALSLSKVCRCLRKTLSAPPSGTVKLQFETERGIADVPYSATPESPTAEDALKPSRIEQFAMLQLPVDLADGRDNYLACLAARTSSLNASFGVWWKQLESGDSFEQLSSQTSFAVAALIESTVNGSDVSNETVVSGSLQGDTYALDYADVWNVTVESRPTPGSGSFTPRTADEDYLLDADAGTVTITNGSVIADGSEVRASYSRYVRVTLSSATPTADIEAITVALTADEIANDHLLLGVFKASDDQQKEILSVKSVEALGAGTYRLTVRRERFGTKPGGNGSYVWTTNDRAFFAFRSTLAPFTHRTFGELRELALAPISDTRTAVAALRDSHYVLINSTLSAVALVYTGDFDMFLEGIDWSDTQFDDVQVTPGMRVLFVGQSDPTYNGIWVIPSYGILKTAAVVLITTNIDLDETLNDYDGVNLVENDRVLLTGQSNPEENGLYRVPDNGQLRGDRTSDADTSAEYNNPFRVPITGGSHSGEVWKYNYLGANPLLDVEAVFFSQYTGGPPLYPGHRAADNDTTDEMASAWKVQVTSGTVHAGQTWAYIPSATDWTFSQLTALTSVDGVSVTTSDRVLLVGQNNPAENGIYTVPSGGVLTLSNRSTDADNAAEFAASFTVSVTSGTEHGGEQWAFLWSQAVTLNTTALNFVNRAAPTSGSFRVVPASAWFEADVADLYDSGTNPNGLTSEDTFDFSDPTAPVVRWTAHFVASGGSWTAITVFSTMYVPNTHFRFEFEATDPNRDLDGYTLNARKGGGDVIHLATEQFEEGTAIATRGVEFELADVGEYDFELSVRDRSGRLTLLPLSSIRIQAGSPTMVSNPVFVPTWNKKRDHADVTFTCATPSATIKWQKQSKGTAPNGGAWTTWTGNKVGVDVKQKVLYAYAVKSGLTDSAVVSLTG